MALKSALREVEHGPSLVTTANFTEFDRSMAEAFPDVDPCVKPFGHNALFQIRQPAFTTRGGILMVGEAFKTEHYNTQVAKVVAVGDLAFKFTRTSQDADGKPLEVLTDHPEGAWFAPGDFVWLPKYGGSRWSKNYDVVTDFDGDKHTMKMETVFVMMLVKDVIGGITGDPLTIKAWLD